MARKMKVPVWAWVVIGTAVLLYVFSSMVPTAMTTSKCPSSQVYCPGVGCVSGQDKCFPGSSGGASKVFSKETFANKKCPDGSRSEGQCLMDFP